MAGFLLSPRFPAARNVTTAYARLEQLVDIHPWRLSGHPDFDYARWHEELLKSAGAYEI